MKNSALFLIVGLLLGLALGWILKGGSGAKAATPGAVREQPASKSTTTRPSGFHQREYPWFPQIERAFLEPRNEDEYNEVKRLVRTGIEQGQFPARMKAVADLCAMMTPDNAHAIRDAFEESWKAGFDYNWERSLFFARYGEVMGAEGANEFLDHPEFPRVVTSFAQAKPEEAVLWVNDLPAGDKRDSAVNRIMFGAGMVDPQWGLAVFESLDPADYSKNQRNLVDAFKRFGGAKSTAGLATDLLGRDDEQMQQVGRYVLNRTVGIYKEGEPEEFRRWLEALPPEHLELLNPADLPEGFVEAGTTRAVGPGNEP